MQPNRAVAMALAFCLLAAPVYADHVPSRHAAPCPESDRVAGRLVEVGLSSAAARNEVAQLTRGELSYFSRDLSRVQVVGASQDMFSGQSDNLWYETLAGMGFIGLGFGIVAMIALSQPKGGS